MTRLLLALCAFGLLVSACQRRPELVAVPLPDMAQSDPPVQQQVREQHAAVMQKVEAGAPDAELGAAFGDLAVLLHGADYLDAAEPAYRNAERLAPEAAEWPYLLGHLYRHRGDVTHAADAFRRALEEAPGDVPTLVWLGRLSLDQGLADEAEALLVRAQAADSRSVAVVAGLGQAALARKDYQRAASRLEEALSIDPRVLAVHAPLAAAYRGLGDTAKADRHARLWVNTEIPLEDPLLDRLAAALESGASYESRGVKAMDAGRLDEAVGLFRQGLALTPADTPLARSIRHKLGLVLHLQGDVKGAVQEFEEAVRLAPAGGRDEPAAQAHYSLGIVMAAGGRDIEAIEHLTKAVSFNAKYGQARLALGDALRRSGRFDAALPQYLEAVQVNPQSVDARLGCALALMRLGRWVDARQWLDEAVLLQPEAVPLAHALARVLAAAPDARVRDGQRALVIVQGLLEKQKNADLGETLAMALAEIGEFGEAVNVQRGLLRAAERSGMRDNARWIAANLRLYEQRRPCRTPWFNEDPVHRRGTAQ